MYVHAYVYVSCLPNLANDAVTRHVPVPNDVRSQTWLLSGLTAVNGGSHKTTFTRFRQKTTFIALLTEAKS